MRMFSKKLKRSHWLIFWGLMLALLPLAASSQVNVIHLSDSKAVSDKDGIIYSLPRTVINVSLVVNKIQKTKGPYAEFADKYLGLTSVISNNSIDYELKEISLTYTEEPDPEQFYFVELGNKSSGKNKSIELYLSEAGLLQDAADVPKSGKQHKAPVNKQQKPEDAFADILNPSLSGHPDTVLSRVSMDSATSEAQMFRKVSVEKDAEQKAKEVADIIIELDEDKLNLLSGEQEVGFGSNLAYMCNRLEAMKAGYLALFKGITSVTSTTYNYSFIPKPGETGEPATLCKFSKLNGTVGNSIAGGDPVIIIVESQGLTKTVSDFVKSKKSGTKGAHGFSYRIPDNAKITVKVGDQTKLEAVFSINQLGVVSSIPARNFSSLRLHPSSGCIKQVIFN
jgi:hypothetical protein